MFLAAMVFIVASCANPWLERSDSRLAYSLQQTIGHSKNRIHGNYCGYGRVNGDFRLPPVDALDAACKAHDACYMRIPDHCACDNQLRVTASRIAQEKGVPAKVKHKAGLISESVSISLCKFFPQGVLPKV